MFTWFKQRDWSAMFGDFVVGWRTTIPGKSLRRALPSIAGSLVVLTLVGLTMLRDSDWRSERLRSNLDDALARRDRAEVELLCRRLLQRSPKDQMIRFQLGVALAAGAQREAAVAQIQELALEENYAPATRWMLNETYQDFDWKEAEPKDLAMLGRLLKIAAAEGIRDKRLLSSYVDYLVANDALDKTRPFLESLASGSPACALQAAAIYRKLGQETAAAFVAERCLHRIQDRLEQNPGNADGYHLKGNTLAFLHRFESALDVFERGAKVTEAPGFRQARAQVLARWSESLDRDHESVQNLARRLRLLQRAVDLAPAHPDVLAALVPLVLESTQAASEKLDKMRDALLRDLAPELRPFMRAATALLRDENDEAVLQLARGTQPMPEAAMIMNHFAVALSRQDDPDLEKALLLIDAALEQTADEPSLYETRGQILLQLERYCEAVPALEKSLADPALAVRSHRRLATAYRALDQDELATAHEHLANSLAPQ